MMIIWQETIRKLIQFFRRGEYGCDYFLLVAKAKIPFKEMRTIDGTEIYNH